MQLQYPSAPLDAAPFVRSFDARELCRARHPPISDSPSRWGRIPFFISASSLAATNRSNLGAAIDATLPAKRYEGKSRAVDDSNYNEAVIPPVGHHLLDRSTTIPNDNNYGGGNCGPSILTLQGLVRWPLDPVVVVVDNYLGRHSGNSRECPLNSVSHT